MSSFRLLPLLLVLILLSVLPAHAVDPAKTLSPVFRHWVNEEVPYIIETEERKQFLSLHSDLERENFIQSFWTARNPTPGSAENSYEVEHYRRLAYANQYFGNTDAQDGWRSDQGRIYITLGEPQQKAPYPNARNVRPLLIWFYESSTPALPVHFYVVFYKRSAGEPYALYSPYQDGPSRLTTGLEDLNQQQRSIQTIRKSLGDEVARITLSLIPTEPVDLSDYKPSLTSDALLSAIKGLPDNPITKEAINVRRGTEVVSSRILTSSTQADMQTATFREAAGGQISYLLFIPHEPIKNLLGPTEKGKLGYSLTLQTTVETKDGKRVYQVSDSLSGTVTQEQATAAQTKRFAAEASLPLAPGEYQIAAALTNNLSYATLRESKTIVVPDLTGVSWGMSCLLAFSHHTEGPVKAKMPFRIAGVRFVPRGTGDVSLHASEPLWLAFQLWARPGQARLTTPSGAADHRIKMTYSYGRISGGAVPSTSTEEIEASNIDVAGNLLTGHMISTNGLELGNYRLVVTATDEKTQQKAFSTLAFHIVPWTLPTDIWTAFRTDTGGQRSDAIENYKRGLSALAVTDEARAAEWFKQSLRDDPKYPAALAGLVDALSRSHQYAEVVSLSSIHPVSEGLDQHTAILMAEADGRLGKPKDGAQLLEAELTYLRPDQELYLALAKLYQAEGDAVRAEEFKHKAVTLKQ